MDWLDLAMFRRPCASVNVLIEALKAALGKDDSWRFLYFWNMRAGKKCMVVKAKRRKQSCPGLCVKCFCVSAAWLFTAWRLSMPLNRNSPYQYTFQSIFTAKLNLVISWKLFLTYPTVVFSFWIIAVFTACLHQTGKGEKKLFPGARHYTRSYLIFTAFLWGKYNCFIL